MRYDRKMDEKKILKWIEGMDQNENNEEDNSRI